MVFCPQLLIHLPGCRGQRMEGIVSNTPIDASAQHFRRECPRPRLGNQIFGAPADVSVSVDGFVDQRRPARHDFFVFWVKCPLIAGFISLNHCAGIRVLQHVVHALSVHEYSWIVSLQACFKLFRGHQGHDSPPVDCFPRVVNFPQSRAPTGQMSDEAAPAEPLPFSQPAPGRPLPRPRHA